MSGLLAASVKWCKLVPVEGFGWTGLFPAAKLGSYGTCVQTGKQGVINSFCVLTGKDGMILSEC